MKLFSKYTIKSLVCVFLLGFATSCSKDYLKTSPSDAVSSDNVFNTVEGGWVALNGAYRLNYYGFGVQDHFGQKSIDLVMDLMGNDMIVHKQGYNHFNNDYQYTAPLDATATARSAKTWNFYYSIINNLNSIITQIDAAAGSEIEKENIKGQAYAFRAYAYFYLVNLFQHTYKGNEGKPGVPIYKEPTTIGNPRSSVQEVYDLILDDLSKASTLLKGKSRKHLSHIDKRTVHAITALVALQMEDYTLASQEAYNARLGINLANTTQILDGKMYNTIGSVEFIWGAEVNTEGASPWVTFYSHIDAQAGGYASLGTAKKITKALYDLIPNKDIRKQYFTALDHGTASNPVLNQNKLRQRQAGIWASDYLYFRAGEMYLIEAESLFKLKDEDGAKRLLEELIAAKNPEYSVQHLSGSVLLEEIWIQRRIELWGEGRALLDIKRLKTGVNRPTGDGNHNGSDLMSVSSMNFTIPVSSLKIADQAPIFLFRIPQDEININDNLTAADQNP